MMYWLESIGAPEQSDVKLILKSKLGDGTAVELYVSLAGFSEANTAEQVRAPAMRLLPDGAVQNLPRFAKPFS